MTKPRNNTPRPDPATEDRADEVAIVDEASQWFMRQDAGLEPSAEREFARWRAADPRHQEAYARIARTWAVFDRVEQNGLAKAVVTRLETRARVRRRRCARAIGVAAGVILLALLTRYWDESTGTAGRLPERATAIAFEPVRRLPDGSIVELNTGAEISVRYESSVRRVRLERGEAHFRVENDPARPFIVSANNIDVRAVGTAFTVQLQSGAIEVIVTHGTVAVEPGGTPSGAAIATSSTRIETGHRAIVPSAPGAPLVCRIQPLTEAEIRERLDWRIPRVQFTAMELKDAVALINRHNRLQIAVGDEAIGRLRISGVFRSDNPEGFVRIVTETFGLRVEHRSEYELVLVATPEKTK